MWEECIERAGTGLAPSHKVMFTAGQKRFSKATLYSYLTLKFTVLKYFLHTFLHLVIWARLSCVTPYSTPSHTPTSVLILVKPSFACDVPLSVLRIFLTDRQLFLLVD